ncbi:hypothetical protein [Acidithiobacillus acidisediminis]|uniref:hypothetical protein n=1 Tax=Acidithiobacillus acidisediminis TaxID=2937799 RepID=UPI00200DF89A|nr:hypothetical protein [Acidithiobacillus sp. S30A2]
MTMLGKAICGMALGLMMVPALAMANANVGTMIFMHSTPINHFGSVSQVSIGANNIGLESFYFGNEKIRIIITPTHHGKRIRGMRYVRIDVQKRRQMVWSIHRWIATPASHLVSLGDGYRFGIVVTHNPPGSIAHPTGKNTS